MVVLGGGAVSSERGTLAQGSLVRMQANPPRNLECRATSLKRKGLHKHTRNDFFRDVSLLIITKQRASVL